MDKDTAKNILEKFCSLPVSSINDVMEIFGSLPDAQIHLDGDKKNFIYIPGKREDRVLLVAHADTVWDEFYIQECLEQSLEKDDSSGKTVFKGINHACGFGADDRAGCAILWLLKDSGHSLLITDGEEHGQVSAHHIKTIYPEIYEELNKHSYMIQFDRRETDNYKVYNLPVSEEFISFIETETGYTDAGRKARTDIIVLCSEICGVNLSIGYYNEHTSNEILKFDEWYKTLAIAESFLSKTQKRYPLKYKV